MFIQQLFADTRCRLEHLQRMINDKELVLARYDDDDDIFIG